MSKRPEINGNLISFSISNGALAAKELPGKLKILNWGKNETVDGPVFVGANTLRLLPANQKKVGFDTIAVDYEHQTIKGHPNFKTPPVEVAAYGAPEVIEGQGLFVAVSEWTPSGNKNAPNYRDLSPAVHLDANGEVDFIHSVALCLQGKVEGLTFYSADLFNLTSLKTYAMDYRLSLLTLLKTLSVTLPDNPSDAEIADAVKNFKPADDKTITSMSVIDERIEKQFGARLKKIEDAGAQAERRNIVALASTQGKVIPLTDEQMAEIPLTTLSAMVEKLPVTVPLAERGHAKQEKTGITALSATQKEICKTLRISEEAYLKSLQAEAPGDLVVV